MTSSRHTARATADHLMLVLMLVLAVIVALNAGDVATTGLTLITGVFDSLTLPPATPEVTR